MEIIEGERWQEEIARTKSDVPFAARQRVPLIGFIYDPKIEYYLEKLDMPSGGKLKEFDKEKTLALVEVVIQNKESYVAKLAQKEK